MSTGKATASLRLQLILIVMSTTTAVLVGLQWVNTRLSERALRQDLQERAAVGFRWRV
jgi:hypothetical protein